MWHVKTKEILLSQWQKDIDHSNPEAYAAVVERRIRQPAVASMFYPDDPSELRMMISSYLDGAIPRNLVPKAIIAPHAGYVYSGSVAASAYVQLQTIRDQIKRVVLLGPPHRVALSGLALSTFSHYRTPLGLVGVDHEADDELCRLPQVKIWDMPHVQEHSLEVHLPFLQITLNDFSLIPIAVGEATAKEVGEVLLKLWGGSETLIVISTDLSHFENYETARKLDQNTCKIIESCQEAGLSHHSACGRVPVSGMLYAAKEKGLTVTTLDLRNSGDTAGSKDRVVGYGSWAIA